MIGTVMLTDWGTKPAGAQASPAGNEGVGEHVRTRFHFELGARWSPGTREIADR